MGGRLGALGHICGGANRWWRMIFGAIMTDANAKKKKKNKAAASRARNWKVMNDFIGRRRFVCLTLVVSV